MERPERAPGRKPGSRRIALGSHLALPLLAALGGAGYVLVTSQAFSQAPAAHALRIELAARRSWWDVRYVHERGRVLAHELRVPVGRPIELVLSPQDTFWGFRLPELGATADVGAGRAGRVLFTARQPGVYRVQGTRLDLIAAEPAEFEDWLAREAAPSVSPTDPLLQNGRAAFFRGGCDGCHTIRGTGARGRAGPDLTHVAARATLAAESLDDHLRLAHVRDRSSSVAAAHRGLEVRAVAGYLASLK